MSMFRSILSATVASLALSTTSVAATITQQQYDDIAERIKPVGGVYLAGSQPEAANPGSTEPRDGATVYGTFCIACHGSGVTGAPIKGNAEQWAPRIAQGQDQMKEHAIKGFNAMPPRGTCMDCSDDEIVAAIHHMIEGL